MSEALWSREVLLSNAAAEGLDGVVCYVGKVNVNLEAMSWLWFVAQELPDTERHFPHDKWATIQHIESQLRVAAKAIASEGAPDAKEGKR